MKIDPSDQINTMKARPSLNGSGSGKANWIAYADRHEEANVSLGDLINEQAEVIKDRDAEIARLQKQIATRKPKGGRPRTSQATIDRIEHSLRQGLIQHCRNGLRVERLPALVDKASCRQSISNHPKAHLPALRTFPA